MSSPNCESDGPAVRPIGDLLYEVTITRQNRVDLFADAVERLDEAGDEADVILRNLRAQAPQLAKHFHRRDSDLIYDVPFRLVCESDLGYVPFDEARVIRQYLVVSYSWRFDESWPGDNMQPFAPWPISRPFVEAILAERGVHTADPGERSVHYRREGIWFDQMCIRQQDEDEKMRSLAMMDIIYKSCRKLLIVLEDVTFDEDEIRIVGGYDALSVQQQASWVPAPEDIPHLGSLCRKIDASRWWTRSWCWHEFEVNEPWSDMRSHYYAHNALLIVGNEKGGTFSLKWLALMAMRAGSGPYADANYTGVDFTEYIRRMLRWTLMDNTFSPYLDPTRRGKSTERSSIMARFYVASSSGCAVVADLITITINVSGLAIFFTGKPQSVDEVFCIVAALALAAGEEHPLTAMGPDAVRVDGAVSWLSRTITGIETNLPKFHVGGLKYIQELTLEHVKLDLLFFETTVDMPTAEEIQWTYQFFPDTPIRSRELRYKTLAETQRQLNSRDDDWDKPRRLFFLNACKNGLAYICRLWVFLQEQVVGKLFHKALVEPFAPAEFYRPAAIRLLDLISPSDASSAEHQDVLVNLLSFITDPRAPSYVMSLLTARIVCNGEESGGVAIVNNPIVRGTSSSVTLDRWRLAMPRDLLDAPWHLSRVWLLEPYDHDLRLASNEEGRSLCESSSDGRWRLVGKMQCLGDPCIPVASSTTSTITRDADRSVTLRTQQVVFG
ncbi:hypothetical protein F5Y17DRAFT_184421 [Xylariaceae sp. FL0594]|nr:hypothetical protein F5Y17DRAFT_184421 [Xylariaceae sp. FL0594]